MGTNNFGLVWLESHTCLEYLEGEYKMTEFSFLGELNL